MTIDQMRNALCETYPGPKWRLKVQEMDQRQVVAIYKSMESKGRLKKHKSYLKKKEPNVKRAVQLTIWDFM